MAARFLVNFDRYPRGGREISLKNGAGPVVVETNRNLEPTIVQSTTCAAENAGGQSS